MKRKTDFLYPVYEEHARLCCNGETLHSDGFRSGPDTLPLPELYQRGLCAIFNLLSGMLPGLVAINVLGIWQDVPDYPFFAFDLWAQIGPEDGFHLPMDTASSLFSQNGIPHYRKMAL